MASTGQTKMVRAESRKQSSLQGPWKAIVSTLGVGFQRSPELTLMRLPFRCPVPQDMARVSTNAQGSPNSSLCLSFFPLA